MPELLVTGGVLVVLLALAAILISPKIDDTQTRNAERRVGVAAIAQALNRYADAHGRMPDVITEEELFIGSGEAEADLCAVLVPEYAAGLPFDPLSQALGEATECPGGAGDYITAYAIQKSGNEVVISAPFTEAPEQIELIIKSTE